MHKYITLALKIMLFISFVFFFAKYNLYKQAVIKQKTSHVIQQHDLNQTYEGS